MYDTPIYATVPNSACESFILIVRLFCLCEGCFALHSSSLRYIWNFASVGSGILKVSIVLALLVSLCRYVLLSARLHHRQCSTGLCPSFSISPALACMSEKSLAHTIIVIIQKLAYRLHPVASKHALIQPASKRQAVQTT